MKIPSLKTMTWGRHRAREPECDYRGHIYSVYSKDAPEGRTLPWGGSHDNDKPLDTLGPFLAHRPLPGGVSYMEVKLNIMPKRQGSFLDKKQALLLCHLGTQVSPVGTSL